MILKLKGKSELCSLISKDIKIKEYKFFFKENKKNQNGKETYFYVFDLKIKYENLIQKIDHMVFEKIESIPKDINKVRVCFEFDYPFKKYDKKFHIPSIINCEHFYFNKNEDDMLEIFYEKFYRQNILPT